MHSPAVIDSISKKPDSWDFPLTLPSRPNNLILDEASLVTQLEASQIEVSTHFGGWERVLYHYYTSRFPDEIQILREGGLLGISAYDDRGAWFNVAGHSLLVAMVAQSAAQIAGAIPSEIKEVTRVALIHDVEKRRQKEYLCTLSPELRTAALTQFEEGGRGLSRVTGAVLNDYEGYNLIEQSLRFADSSVGAWNGKESIINWARRIEQLKSRDVGVGHSQDVGNRHYNGRAFYDFLTDVTAFCERNLYMRAIDRMPSVLGQGLPADFLRLVVNNIGKIIQHEVGSSYEAHIASSNWFDQLSGSSLEWGTIVIPR